MNGERVSYTIMRSLLSIACAVVACSLWSHWNEHSVGLLFAVLSIGAIVGAFGAVLVNADGINPEEEKYLPLFGKIFGTVLAVSITMTLSPLLFVAVIGVFGVLVSATATTMFIPAVVIRPAQQKYAN